MRKLRPHKGFSFIEMVTVVAIIAIIVSAAVPVASSLFQRRRELFLRESLLLMRQGIRDFAKNQRDDDSDSELDEDPRGDRNHDGFPGIRGIDDNGDLLVDTDWGLNRPFIDDGSADDGKVNPRYDWRLRADDDEDLTRDEEAYPSDLFDLVNRTTILRGRVPRDPTTQQPAWGEKLLRGTNPSIFVTAANNDLDWTDPGCTPDQYSQLGNTATCPVIASLDNVFVAAEDVVLAGTFSGSALIQLIDEDPRNGIDDDKDGRRDEDPADFADVFSLNSDLSTNLTTYSSW